MNDKPILMRDFSAESKQAVEMLTCSGIDYVQLFSDSGFHRLPYLLGSTSSYRGIVEIRSYLRSAQAGVEGEK